MVVLLRSGGGALVGGTPGAERGFLGATPKPPLLGYRRPDAVIPAAVRLGRCDRMARAAGRGFLGTTPTLPFITHVGMP